MNYILVSIGVWLWIDGVGSIIVYRKQKKKYEHIIRVVRAVCGVALILL